MADGSTWGGDGGYADIPGWIAANPAEDIPFVAWYIPRNDFWGAITPPGFSDQIAAAQAFEDGHHGYAWCWAEGNHDNDGSGAINRDGPGADSTKTYYKSWFGLNKPFLVLSNSSINDDPGTGTRNGSGVYDGDVVGCRNMGFTWNFTSDTAGALNFTVNNTVMGQSTTIPQTTLVDPIGASGGDTITLADASGFQSVGSAWYFLVGGTEIIRGTALVGNELTYSASRPQLSSTIGAHAAGQSIVQLITKSNGPNAGPYTTMTVDVTPRRIQNFVKGRTDGQIIDCAITPNGGSTTHQFLTVLNSVFTILSVIINATGATVIACS